MISEVAFAELVRLLNAGRLVPFVGAGVSAASGMPSWLDLVGALARQLDTDIHEDPTYLAQYYENEFGRPRLEEEVQRALGHRYTSLDIQRSIARWPVDIIVTSNFDALLERACDQESRAYTTFCMSEHLYRWSACSGLKLFKIHGDLASSFVLTEQDFQTYEVEQGPSFHLLSSLLATRPFLFIGCSLRDPNFRRVFHRARTVLSRRGQTLHHYCLLPAKNEYETSMWRQFGINVLSIDESDPGRALAMLTAELAARTIVQATGLLERQQLFEYHEAAYLSGTADVSTLIIRKESDHSHMSIPEEPNVFSHLDDPDFRLQTAIRRRDVYLELLRRGATMKLLLAPTAQGLLSKGYPVRSACARLRTLREFVAGQLDAHQVQVRIRADWDRGSSTLCIYGTDFLLLGGTFRTMVPRAVRRESVQVIRDPRVVENAIFLFEDRFDFHGSEMLRGNGSASGSSGSQHRERLMKEMVINRLDAELAVLAERLG